MHAAAASELEEGEISAKTNYPPPFNDNLADFGQYYLWSERESGATYDIRSPRGLADLNFTHMKPCGTDYLWTWSRQLPFERSVLKRQWHVDYSSTHDFLFVTEIVNRVFTWHIRAISLVRYAGPETLRRTVPVHYGVIFEFYGWDGLLWRTWRDLEHYYRAVVLLALKRPRLPSGEWFPANTYAVAQFNHWQ